MNYGTNRAVINSSQHSFSYTQLYVVLSRTKRFPLASFSISLMLLIAAALRLNGRSRKFTAVSRYPSRVRAASFLFLSRPLEILDALAVATLVCELFIFYYSFLSDLSYLRFWSFFWEKNLLCNRKTEQFCIIILARQIIWVIRKKLHILIRMSVFYRKFICEIYYVKITIHNTNGEI